MVRAILVLALAGAFLVGCSTSQGTGFADEVHRERAARPPAPSPEPRPTPTPRPDSPADGGLPGGPTTSATLLTLRTDPPNARIFVDGQDVGIGSHVFDTTFRGGGWRVLVTAEGYHPKSLWVAHDGQSGTEDVALAPVTGTLDLRGLPDGTEVRIDRSLGRTGAQPVRVGRRTVEWKKFGFQAGGAQALVKENETTVLDASQPRTENDAHYLAEFSAKKRIITTKINRKRIWRILIFCYC